MRFEQRGHERKWMAEKDRMLRELDHCKSQLNMDKKDILNVSAVVMEKDHRKDEEIKVSWSGHRCEIIMSATTR